MLRLICLALVAIAAPGVVGWASAAEAPAIPDRPLMRGDTVQLTVVGEKDLTRSVVIDASGAVSMGTLGKVRIAGMTPAAASAAIRKALLRYMRDPEVSVELAEQRFSVMGAVMKPGQYTMPGDRIPLLDALAQAGGPAERANLRSVTLVRQTASGPRKYRVDVRRAIDDKERGHAGLPEMQSGDVLYVEDRPRPIGATILSVAGVVASLAWLLR